ncbi:hypothetical protein B0H14DRAFT_2630132 [Mycena olivaceomarginata]|nr:hypothetical protein B0H14DRAFT_2630132 [Mycena olivaceomarginata]
MDGGESNTAPCFAGAINFHMIRVFAGPSPEPTTFPLATNWSLATLDSSDSFELVNQQPLFVVIIFQPPLDPSASLVGSEDSWETGGGRISTEPVVFWHFLCWHRINDDGQKKRNQSGERPQLSCGIGQNADDLEKWLSGSPCAFYKGSETMDEVLCYNRFRKIYSFGSVQDNNNGVFKAKSKVRYKAATKHSNRLGPVLMPRRHPPRRKPRRGSEEYNSAYALFHAYSRQIEGKSATNPHLRELNRLKMRERRAAVKAKRRQWDAPQPSKNTTGHHSLLLAFHVCGAPGSDFSYHYKDFRGITETDIAPSDFARRDSGGLLTTQSSEHNIAADSVDDVDHSPDERIAVEALALMAEGGRTQGSTATAPRGQTATASEAVVACADFSRATE